MSDGNLNRIWLDRLRSGEYGVEGVDTLNLIGACHEADRLGDAEWVRRLEVELAEREAKGTYGR